MNKNIQLPPDNDGFWEMFDYFWDNGLGRKLSEDREPVAWSSSALEEALDHKVDIRSIENWRSRKFMPTRENIRKLCRIISDGDDTMHKVWSDAFIAAWRDEKRKTRVEAKAARPSQNVKLHTPKPFFAQKHKRLLLAGAGLLGLGIASWVVLGSSSQQSVANIRICDAPYFDKEAKDCSKHVAVFVEGIKEIFLSFDLENVPNGAPFERWWIRNGERVTGRTSYNDEAWPGYTYWRPEGGLPFGQYVVRIVVDGRVHTQTFQIQKEGFNVEN